MSCDSHKVTTKHYREKTEFLLQDMPDYVADFIREIKNTTSERTQYEYTLDIRHLLFYLAVGKPLTDILLSDIDNISEDKFEDYVSYLAHYEENGKDVYNGDASIKRKLVAVRSFMNYLYQEGKIQNTEIRKIPIPKVPESDVIYLNEEETEKLKNIIIHGTGLSRKQRDYHKLQSIRDLSIVFLILTSGIRVSECAELDITDINLEDACIRIVRKDGDEMSIDFSEDIIPYLEEYLKYRKTIPGAEHEPALFLSSQKRRMSMRAIENMITKYAGMVIPNKNVTPHKLRATYAAKLYEETGDIELVTENMRYKNTKTTKERYKNLSDTSNAKTSEELTD